MVAAPLAVRAPKANTHLLSFPDKQPGSNNEPPHVHANVPNRDGPVLEFTQDPAAEVSQRARADDDARAVVWAHRWKASREPAYGNRSEFA